MNFTRRSLLSGIPAFMLGANRLQLLAEESKALLSDDGNILLSTESVALTRSFASNPELPTTLKGWMGTPRDSSGRFVNHEHPHDDNIFRLIDWQLQGNKSLAEKKRDTFKLRVVRDDSFLKHDYDCIVWFGHSTFYIRVGGVSFITDPLFGNIFLRERLCSLPVSPDAITNLDFVLLSHVHQDHADEASMKYVAKKNPQTQFLCGLEAGELIGDWTGSKKITEAGWFQQYDTTKLAGGRNVEVFYLPARHWSRRTLFDQNKQLWGGFVIRANNRTIFFSADTGYGSHFKQVKELFGKIDVCVIGVGAYKPEWFMAQNHTSPHDAVRGAEDMGANMMIPMHYGTYDLSDDAPGDPVRALEQIRRDGKDRTEINISPVGEIVRI